MSSSLSASLMWAMSNSIAHCTLIARLPTSHSIVVRQVSLGERQVLCEGSEGPLCWGMFPNESMTINIYDNEIPVGCSQVVFRLADRRLANSEAYIKVVYQWNLELEVKRGVIHAIQQATL